MGPVTITLPVPTPYTIEPARLVAWLVERGWRPCQSHDPGFRSFEQDGEIVSLEVEPWDPDYARTVIVTWAHRACLTAHALAAQLGPTASGHTAARYTLTIAPVLSPLQRAWVAARKRSDSGGDRRDWQECDAAQEDEERAEAALTAAGEPLPTGPAFAPVNVEVDASVALGLMAPPTAGPALQWAHASADTRAPVLALLDGPAVEHRAAATLARMADDIESALAHEGRAMALEAAAAVLRASR